MNIIRSAATLTAWSRSLHREGVAIGFVPTMGALHAGHAALIRSARLGCDAVVVSIFVNPTQFGPKEDLSKYPRPLKRDLALCRAHDVDAVFLPDVPTMYPPGSQTAVTVPALASRWEGAVRPITSRVSRPWSQSSCRWCNRTSHGSAKRITNRRPW